MQHPQGVPNLLHLKPGGRLRLTSGATAAIIENPMDGMWLRCRLLSDPTNPAAEGEEEQVFAQDIAEVLPPDDAG